MGNGILVLCEHSGGTFKKTAFELLGKAAELAASIGGPVTALVIGHGGGAELGGFGASQVLAVDGPEFADYNTGPQVRAIQAAVEASNPAVLLAPSSPAARDALPRLSARLNVGLATEVVALSVQGGQVVGRRPVYGGKALADVVIDSSLAMFTVRANAFPVPSSTGATAPVSSLSVKLSERDLAVKVVGHEAPATTAVDLTEADRIVSGGRSLKSLESFDAVVRPLADALHASVGASRAAVDAGYAKHSEQVGQTGKTVNPNVYIALGISGAIQHLAGMRTSKVIVAVNKDAEAPIFQVATYGIVADLFEIAPLLGAELHRVLEG